MITRKKKKEKSCFKPTTIAYAAYSSITHFEIHVIEVEEFQINKELLRKDFNFEANRERKNGSLKPIMKKNEA